MERVGLTVRRHVPAGVLSYAEQRALEIGVTIGGNADVVLLDEPTAGMNNSETEQAVALIRKVTEGKTPVMVEHDMGVVFSLADRISVLVHGQIIASDTPERIREIRLCARPISARQPRDACAFARSREPRGLLRQEPHSARSSTFYVGEGEIVGLIGRNGVGRSTSSRRSWATSGHAAPSASVAKRSRA